MAFVVAGYAAVRLRPASPAGPMLLACGVLWYVGSYSPSGQPVVMYIGFAFERYYDLVLGALLLILLRRAQRLEPRWLVIGFAAAFAFRSFGRLFFFDPATMFDCADCHPNPFAFWPDLAAWEATEVIGSYAIAAFAAAVGVVVVARLLSAGPVLKRARGPILVAGILAMGAATFDAFEYGYTTANQVPLLELEGVADWLFSWGLFAARVLVPLAILVAILRMRAAPGPLGGFAAGLDQPGGSTAGDALRRALVSRCSCSDRLRTAVGSRRTGPLPSCPGRKRRGTSPSWATRNAGGGARPRPGAAREPELVAAVTRVLRLALENERLQTELQAQLEVVTGRGPASCRPPRRSAAAWSATSTTGRSSGWWPRRSPCGRRGRPRTAAAPGRGRSPRGGRTSSRTPSASCASSPAASTRRSWRRKGSGRPWRAWRAGRGLPVEVHARWTAGCRHWLSRPPTSRSRRRSPTRSDTSSATQA